IEGEKWFITYAWFADTIIVTAVKRKYHNGKNIMSAIIVRTDAERLTIRSEYYKLRLRGSDTAEMVLDHVRVPKENLLGDLQGGFKQFLYTLDGGRISIAALGLGIAQASLEKALNYAKERKQFGKSISKFQAIQFKLADMSMNVE